MKKFDPKVFLEEAGEGRTLSRYKAGAVIMKQGSEAEHVFYLVSGRAKETVTSDGGKDAVVSMLGPGLFFGSSALDGHAYRLSTVIAMTPCAVTAIERDAMTEALKETVFAQMFVSYLLDQNIKIEAEKVDLLLNSSEKRLAQRLLILSRASVGEPQLIGPEITQEMLADMIGTTRPRVNYFLNRFRKMGLISYRGGIVVQPGLLRLVLTEKGD